MRPQDALLEELKQRACEGVELNAARLGALSRSIWSRPELAYEEHHAHDALTRFFASGELPGAAWAVRPRYKLGTAFRADWGTAGPQGPPAPLRIAFLCEYDALPGIGHACGHNLIAEVGAAAALGLKAALESLPQPAPSAVQVGALLRVPSCLLRAPGRCQLLTRCVSVVGRRARDACGGARRWQN